MLLLIVGLFSGALWYVDDRGERRAEQVRLNTVEAERVLRLEQGIEDAIANANTLREKSWMLTGRHTEWEAMLASARAACEHAQSLVEQEPQLIDPELVRGVEELSRELDADEQDQQVAVRYDEILLEAAKLDAEEFYFSFEDAFWNSREALSVLGLHVGDTPVGHAVEKLLSRPPAVQKIWIAATRPALDNVDVGDKCVWSGDGMGSGCSRSCRFQSLSRRPPASVCRTEFAGHAAGSSWTRMLSSRPNRLRC